METKVQKVVINSNPRPRMLVRGFSGNVQAREEVGILVPTFQVIESLRDVRQAEWDVLLTDQPLSERVDDVTKMVEPSASPHLCTIYIASGKHGERTVDRLDSWKAPLQVLDGLISQELLRIKGLPDRIADLTHEQLEPVLRNRWQHQYFRYHASAYSSFGPAQGPPRKNAELESFIESAQGFLLAGRYKRSDKSEGWLLPGDVPDLVSWVRVALGEWHHLAPDCFPGMPDWSQEQVWLTNTERALVSELEELDRKREAMLTDLADRERVLQMRLKDANESANRYERALLTTQSEDLVQVVIKALRELGFKVTDMDPQARPKEYLEDLRIEDPSAPNWIALGEVKGYSKGAKTEALTQFLRFNARYVEERGVMPNANWYIVNQFMKRDPSSRQPVLHGSDGDVSAFASAGGSIIDTVQLFSMLDMVRNRKLSHEEARRRLRSSKGRFELSSSKSE